MFRKIRIMFLLYILLFVAVSQMLTVAGTTDWDNPLWVEVWLVNADGAEATREYIDHLDPEAFAGIEGFFVREAGRYGVNQPQPFRIQLAGVLDAALPALPRPGDWLGTVHWSLAMRWFAMRLHWHSDRPTPDITVFARYHAGDAPVGLDRSTALRKGMLAIANLYALRQMQGSNQVIIAHELLHTLGATDKYDSRTNLPLVPLGLGDPGDRPLFPQSRAELMAGRIAVSPTQAITPSTMAEVVIGEATAVEIGWIPSLPAANDVVTALSR